MLSEKTLENIAQIFKLMSDPTRLSILILLQKKQHNVTEISDSLEIEQSVVSHQLQKLKMGGLVKARREGRKMVYSHDDEHVKILLYMAIEHAKELENK